MKEQGEQPGKRREYFIIAALGAVLIGSAISRHFPDFWIGERPHLVETTIPDTTLGPANLIQPEPTNG